MGATSASTNPSPRNNSDGSFDEGRGGVIWLALPTWSVEAKASGVSDAVMLLA